jgi:RHS repeat-associated protein
LIRAAVLPAFRVNDYLPFGEELANVGRRTTAQGYTGNDGARQKFTQKERDIETGLDYFEARYYSFTQGRFTSPDAPFADQSADNPQSWNLYSYVRNSPVIMIDPTGRRTGDYYDQ